MSSVCVGLRILTSDISSNSSASGFGLGHTSTSNSNVVLNHGVRSIKPIFELNQRTSSETETDANPIPPDCFLKSCFLCSKILRLDEDVYMYRGDQGFCSVACRNRQIYIDEIKELEKSTRRTLASFRCSRSSCNCCRHRPRDTQMGPTPASIFHFPS